MEIECVPVFKSTRLQAEQGNSEIVTNKVARLALVKVYLQRFIRMKILLVSNTLHKEHQLRSIKSQELDIQSSGGSFDDWLKFKY